MKMHRADHVLFVVGPALVLIAVLSVLATLALGSRHDGSCATPCAVSNVGAEDDWAINYQNGKLYVTKKPAAHR